jgi:hypothetical protein
LTHRRGGSHPSESGERPLLCSVAALGLLMNRAPLYAGPETVVPADFVARAYEAFQRFDWAGPELTECCCLAGSFMSSENEAVLTWAQSLERRIPYAIAGRRPLCIAADDRSWRNCRVPPTFAIRRISSARSRHRWEGVPLKRTSAKPPQRPN